MNENLEFLEYIYQTADMGCKVLTDLLSDLKDKDNKIKVIIEKELKGYEKYLKESKKLLKKNKTNPKEKGIMADVMSKFGIKKEVMRDNSDSAIASMLTEGFTMGNLELQKRLDNFEKNVSKDVILLAKNFIKFGEDSINDLKKYL